jgi:hypothetical protein
MHQYNNRVPLERIAVDVAGPFPLRDQGNRYLLITMDYFTKWTEAYAIPIPEVLTVAEALVINFPCRFCIPQEFGPATYCLENLQTRNYPLPIMRQT